MRTGDFRRAFRPSFVTLLIGSTFSCVSNGLGGRIRPNTFYLFFLFQSLLASLASVRRLGGVVSLT
jgi:hypothetical protein